MNWLILALLAPAVFAIVNFIDKYLLAGAVGDWRSLSTYSSIIALVLGLLLWAISGFPLLSIQAIILLLFTGMLTVWGAVFYFKALSQSETSKIIILFQLGPIITLLLSLVFLKETISVVQLMGFFMILLATLAISVDKKQKGFQLSQAFLLIMLSNLFWALSYVLFKYVSGSVSFFKMVSYQSLGFALGGWIIYLLFPAFRKAFRKTRKKIGKTILILILLNEVIYFFAKVLTFWAISLGPVALVNVISGTQVFFGIFYGLVLTIIAPKIFQENISQGDLFKKIVMASLVIGGLWLVQN